jgi:hypothetical protein
MAKQPATNTTQQPAAAQQATTQPAGATVGWRVVVRGTTKGGTRQRGVQTVQAGVDGAAAYAQAGALAQAMAQAKGWQEGTVFYNVYPPVGVLCNGGISKGFAVENGYVVRATAAAAK